MRFCLGRGREEEPTEEPATTPDEVGSSRAAQVTELTRDLLLLRLEMIRLRAMQKADSMPESLQLACARVSDTAMALTAFPLEGQVNPLVWGAIYLADGIRKHRGVKSQDEATLVHELNKLFRSGRAEVRLVRKEALWGQLLDAHFRIEQLAAAPKPSTGNEGSSQDGKDAEETSQRATARTPEEEVIALQELLEGLFQE